uniref:Uncharacterized protein n=1 Tax=Rhipicephalus microplus TaxID=6941 RepID=A0A6G5AG71_RHIMP
MSDDDEKAMLSTTFCFLAVTEVSLGPRYFVRCHVQFFLFPACLRVLWTSTGKTPCAFSVLSFFSVAPGTQKKVFFFHQLHTNRTRVWNGPYKPLFDKPSHTHGRKREGHKKQLWRMGWKDVAGCFIGTPGQPVCLISVCSFQSCL